eukprot:gene11344-4512_t
MLNNSDFKKIISTERSIKQEEHKEEKKQKKKQKKKPKTFKNYQQKEEVFQTPSNYRDRVKERKDIENYDSLKPKGLDPKLKQEIFGSDSDEDSDYEREDDDQEMVLETKKQVSIQTHIGRKLHQMITKTKTIKEEEPNFMPNFYFVISENSNVKKKLKEKYHPIEPPIIENFSNEFLNTLSKSVENIKKKMNQPNIEDLEIDSIFDDEDEYVPEIPVKKSKEKKEKLFKDTGSDIFVGDKIINPEENRIESLDETEMEVNSIEINNEKLKEKISKNETDEYAECYPSAYNNYSNVAYNSEDDDVDFEKMKEEYSIFKEGIESVGNQKETKKRKKKDDGKHNWEKIQKTTKKKKHE